MSEEAQCLDSRALLRSWLNKIIKVKISDGRRLIGSFLCTDKDMNIILGSCQEYVHEEDFENENPRILGLAMVPGKHIVSLEIDQQTPSSEKQFKLEKHCSLEIAQQIPSSEEHDQMEKRCLAEESELENSPES